MWINCKNLCFTDIEDLISGENPRRSAHIMIKDPIEATMRELKLGRNFGWVIGLRTVDGSDPKFHFTDMDKGQRLYEKLCHMLVNPAEYYQVDALEEGAL